MFTTKMWSFKYNLNTVMVIILVDYVESFLVGGKECRLSLQQMATEQ